MSEIVHPMSSSARQMSAIVEVGRNSLAFAKFTAFIRFRIENCWYKIWSYGYIGRPPWTAGITDINLSPETSRSISSTRSHFERIPGRRRTICNVPRMCAGGLARLSCRTGLQSTPAPWRGPQRCGASAQSANNCLRFSMQLQAMTRSRRTHLPGLAMRCTIVAPGDVCPLRERRFAGPGDLVRGVRTICFIPSSRQQPIFSPLFRAVWSVNAKTQAAAGCFWTVPTPARDGGAAWRTAATEIRPGNTTGARPV